MNPDDSSGAGGEERTTSVFAGKDAVAAVLASCADNNDGDNDSVGGAVDKEKRHDIKAACADGDIPRLQALAESRGGFLTDRLRQLACKAETTHQSPDPRAGLLYCY